MLCIRSTNSCSDGDRGRCYFVRAMVVEQAERSAAKDVGVEALLSILVVEGLLPVGEGEVEDTPACPALAVCAAAIPRRFPHGHPSCPCWLLATIG
jgi:hypothetical protein